MLRTPRTFAPRRGLDPRTSAPAVIVLGSTLLAALTLLGPSAPTYDPWAWIIWGREITQLDLNTVHGPSWKPLPVVVTTLSAPLGEDGSPYVWMLVARAGGVASVALAFLLARRLAGTVAGVAAAAALALSPWYVRTVGLGNSEGLMVALLLGAILAHLGARGRTDAASPRYGWAFALAVGCGLLRPEAWPFLALYALWLVWDERSRLLWVAAGMAGMLAAWLGPELWGSGDAWRASARAQQPNPDSPAFADDPALKVVENAIGMVPVAAVAGVVLLVVVAVARRRATGSSSDLRTAVGLLALAAAWIALVAAMTVRGFSGNQRYLVVPAVLLVVLGAVGIVWAATLLLPRLRRAGAAAAAVMAAALAAALAAPDVPALDDTWRSVAYQAELERDLGAAIAGAGGAERLLGCGQAYTGPYLVPAVAWHLGTHIGQVGLTPEPPAVVFHVRTSSRAPGFMPELSAGGPEELARRGGWVLTADCRGTR